MHHRVSGIDERFHCYFRFPRIRDCSSIERRLLRVDLSGRRRKTGKASRQARARPASGSETRRARGERQRPQDCRNSAEGPNASRSHGRNDEGEKHRRRHCQSLARRPAMSSREMADRHKATSRGLAGQRRPALPSGWARQIAAALATALNNTKTKPQSSSFHATTITAGQPADGRIATGRDRQPRICRAKRPRHSPVRRDDCRDWR